MSQHDFNNEPLEINRSTPKIAFVIVAVIVLGVFGSLFYFKNYGQTQASGWQPQAVPVTAMQVTPQSLPLSLEAIGSLTAVQQVMLSTETAGRVQAINFQSGQSVDQGTLLLQLNSAPEQAALASAKANVRFAQSQLQRTEKLNRTGVEPLDALQMRRSTYDQAAAEVTRLEAQLRQKQIVAPFAGELGIRQVNLGQYINPGEAIVSLTALDELYVEFSIPQQHLAALQKDAEVALTSDAYPDKTFTAYVNAVEPQVNANTRNIRVQALLDNHAHILRPGMYVNAALALETRSEAIVVPNTAVQTSAQGHMVTVVRGENAIEQGQAEVVPVEVGERIGEQIVIRSGLKANDVIVTVGQNRLQPGAEVTVTELVQGEEQ